MDLMRARLRRLSESLRSLPERLGRSAAVPAPDRRTHSVRQGDGRPPASQHGADYSQAGSSSDSGDTVRQYITIDEVMAFDPPQAGRTGGQGPVTGHQGGWRADSQVWGQVRCGLSTLSAPASVVHPIPPAEGALPSVCPHRRTTVCLPATHLPTARPAAACLPAARLQAARLPTCLGTTRVCCPRVCD